MVKNDKEKIVKEDYAPLELIKYCVNCGRQSMSQNPAHTNEGILTCSNCQVQFKVVIVK